MTLLRLEFFKGRRRKIAILCLACLGIQTAWMVVNLLRMEPEELAQGWMQLVYTLLLVDAITLPLTMAALASRTCELEHKENTWKLLETLARPQALYRAKLTWGAILILGWKWRSLSASAWPWAFLVKSPGASWASRWAMCFSSPWASMRYSWACPCGS